MPDISGEHAHRALASFINSCNVVQDEGLTLYDVTLEAQQWKALCTKAMQVRPQQAAAFFTQHFDLYRLRTAQHDTGLLTGYYVPLLQGSPERSESYSVPVYAKPPEDMRTAYRRAEIEAGALEGRVENIVYLADKVDAFFLHIQGSGKVQLPDGDIKLLRYAGKNEFAYTAIGKEFIERGEVAKEEMSLQWLKNWLRTHPEQADAVMARNESYIFFELVESADDIIGAQNVPLTPMASIAIDPAHISYGALMMVEATLPDGRPLQQLVVAQDTGSAIRGFLRADLYMGTGGEAERLAGALKADAVFYALLPKGMRP